jgi:hypothetical protein
MKIVEGFFNGEVVIPVVPKKHGRPHKLQAGEGYAVTQFMLLPDGTWLKCPDNEIRILEADRFVTCLHPGTYKFVIHGVLSEEEEEHFKHHRHC